jgi:signal transduction histidine kinase
MEFKIADTGTGIAADHLSDIFERFARSIARIREPQQRGAGTLYRPEIYGLAEGHDSGGEPCRQRFDVYVANPV